MPTIKLYNDDGDVNGPAIRAIREILGISTRELAEQLDVTYATVNRWELNRYPMRQARSRILPLLDDLVRQADERLARLRAERPADYERLVRTLPPGTLEEQVVGNAN